MSISLDIGMMEIGSDDPIQLEKQSINWRHLVRIYLRWRKHLEVKLHGICDQLSLFGTVQQLPDLSLKEIRFFYVPEMFI